MIKKIILKNKINSVGEPCFPFEEIFPKYNKEIKPFVTQRALDAWKQFIADENCGIPFDLLPTLLMLEDQINKLAPNSYGKLLNYIFQNNFYSDKIAQKLFFELHRLWDASPYFQQLLNIQNWLTDKSPTDDLVIAWKKYSPILLGERSPYNAAVWFIRSPYNIWKQKPRTLERIPEICKCLDVFCQKFYQKPLKNVVNHQYESKFVYVFAKYLFRLANEQLNLADNFTQDFIFNPNFLDDERFAAQVPLCSQFMKQIRESLSQLKQPLYPLYEKRLINQYEACLKKCEFSSVFLRKLEDIIVQIYNLYPIDYQHTPQNKLPEYRFISQVIEKLINSYVPNLTLCSKFMNDLRLRSSYPAYDKITGTLIQTQKHLWQKEKPAIKEQYLQQLYQQYTPSLTHYNWDGEFLHLLRGIEENFYKTYFDETEKQLYIEFFNAVVKYILTTAQTQLNLCQNDNFHQDIRLQDVNKLDISDSLKSILKPYWAQYDKISVLADYVCHFNRLNLFNTLNSMADRLYDTLTPHWKVIEQRQIKDSKYREVLYAFKKYKKTRDIFEFTKNDDPNEEQRRKFWVSMREEIDYITLLTPLVLIKLRDHLILESFNNGNACYYQLHFFTNYQSDVLIVQAAINSLVAREKTPVRVAEQMQIPRSQSIIHKGAWQAKARRIFLK